MISSTRFVCLVCVLLSSVRLLCAQSVTPSFDLVQPVAAPLGALYPQSEATGVVSDAWGNTYVSGYFTGSVQFGPYTLTAPSSTTTWPNRFLAKLDSQGNYLWVLDVGSNLASAAGRAMTVDAAGNVYLLGSYLGPSVQFGPFQLQGEAGVENLYVVKLAPDGTFQWARQAAGALQGTSVVADEAGNLVISGRLLTGTATFGATTLHNPTAYVANMFVAKLTAAGQWQWAVQSRTEDTRFHYQAGPQLALDQQGTVYLTGTFETWDLTLGSTTLTNNSLFTSDAFVAKLDGSGHWQWAHRIGGGAYEHGMGIGVSATEDVVVYGDFHGDMDAESWVQLRNTSGATDVFVAKLTRAGQVQWATKAGGRGFEQATGLALDAWGNAYVSGYSDSAPAAFGSATIANPDGEYQYNAFVAKLDPAGTWQWVQQSGGVGVDRGYDVAVDPSGIVWTIGSYRSPTNQFSAFALPGDGTMMRSYVARLGSSPYVALVGSVEPATGSVGQLVTLKGARFVGVTGVFFNGIPASTYTVVSPTELHAVVPFGATTGSVRVQTSAGNSVTAPSFQVSTPLASTRAQAAQGHVWPVPVTDDRRVHIRVPATWPAGVALHLCLRSSVGSLVRVYEGHGPETTVSLRDVPAGVYVLTVSTPARLPFVRRLVLP
ncbi:hypothetical protein [Hymenobacter sp. GOD-10R]|uniref:hypothetical protein n=1 Tax=Hymenobacter sp. GOD-10R TaxID=3093922 RepID=UPI002D782777|nr:hypothetical protein [Hymenobacter sp. GOD-10R]WRQ31122.1 hypothetical protein SD425_12720 [Hymenobacter sp. GOD-10R]